jgi:hypothetical protein
MDMMTMHRSVGYVDPSGTDGVLYSVGALKAMKWMRF